MTSWINRKMRTEYRPIDFLNPLSPAKAIIPLQIATGRLRYTDVMARHIGIAVLGRVMQVGGVNPQGIGKGLTMKKLLFQEYDYSETGSPTKDISKVGKDLAKLPRKDQEVLQVAIDEELKNYVGAVPYLE